MLVLSRKEHQKILLPTLGVSVEVLRVQGQAVRIGIAAPSDVPIVREEIADLKGIDFAPDTNTTSRQLSTLNQAIRQHTATSADALNLLHEHLEGDIAAQSLVMEVFEQLRGLEREATRVVGGDSHKSSVAPHALVVASDRNERQLLASCLRWNGFEVTTANNGDEALGYLSLHARPDFVLFDSATAQSAQVPFVTQIRTESGCERLKCFAHSDTEPSGVDRWFPRPFDLERLVQELSQEFPPHVAA